MTRQNFLLFITSHHDVSEKRFFENKKKQSEIFNSGLRCQARQVALKKSLRLHTHGGPAAAAEQVY